MPALRLRGLYLAVTTFAFALATTSFLLNDEWFGWVPVDRIERAPLLGGFEVASEAATYYLALAVFVLVGLGLRGVRTSRFGRALVAVRDNEAAAESYGVDPVRLRLAAFSLSGAIAALAGGLFVHHERAFDPSSYSPIENLAVLTMVVIGGMTSVAGAAARRAGVAGLALVPRPRVAVPGLRRRGAAHPAPCAGRPGRAGVPRPRRLAAARRVPRRTAGRRLRRPAARTR